MASRRGEIFALDKPRPGIHQILAVRRQPGLGASELAELPLNDQSSWQASPFDTPHLSRDGLPYAVEVWKSGRHVAIFWRCNPQMQVP